MLKSVAPGSLPGFLRQHYTTSSDMAGVLSAYLVSNGATDTRYQAKDGAQDGKKDKEKEAATNPAQGGPEQSGRRNRTPRGLLRGLRARRPDGGRAGQEAHGAAGRGRGQGRCRARRRPEGRKSKHSRRGKPEADEAPKADAPKGETPKDMQLQLLHLPKRRRTTA